MSATRTLTASAAAVFDVLADPSRHAGIDGTGWVTSAVDTLRIAAVGELFRMAMFHPDHPDGGYETVNEVTAHDEPRVLAWRTGYVEPVTGELRFGGWWWRYDLTAVAPDRTEVTLTYDWSDVGPEPREYLTFPVFADGHLERSLEHLAGLVAGD